MKKIALITAVLILAGCALTYSPPQTKPVDITQQISNEQSKVFNSTLQALALEGYTITNQDQATGLISTAYKEMQPNEAVADCGTTAGLDYLKDHRTILKVAMAAIIKPNALTLKASFEGSYRPGDQLQNITLICVSRGKLERELMQKIVSQAG